MTSSGGNCLPSRRTRARPDRSAMRNEIFVAPSVAPSSRVTVSTASTGEAVSAASRTPTSQRKTSPCRSRRHGSRPPLTPSRPCPCAARLPYPRCQRSHSTESTAQPGLTASLPEHPRRELATAAVLHAQTAFSVTLSPRTGARGHGEYGWASPTWKPAPRPSARRSPSVEPRQPIIRPGVRSAGCPIRTLLQRRDGVRRSQRHLPPHASALVGRVPVGVATRCLGGAGAR